MNKITPFLWFNNNAGEAMEYYASVFPNSKVINSGPMGGICELAGQQVMTLNGGPQFQFTEAVSFYVNCEDQEEVDFYWNRLIGDGGVASKCGWLKDKYGLSWQIIPTRLWELLRDPDRAKSQRVMRCMLGMSKIIVEDLEKAYEG